MESKRPDPQLEALNRTYKQLSGSLCFFATGIIHDPDDAKSIVNDVFVKFRKQKKDFDSKDVQGLLRIAVLRDCLDYLRKKKTKKENHRRWLLENAMAEEDPLSTNAMIKAELIDCVYKAMETLPRAQRAAIKGYFLEGIPSEELAAKYGITISTLHGNKDKGLAGMMAYLEKILKKKLGKK